METLTTLFGKGHDLSVLQMTCRGLVVFVIALLLIRLAGRRSFGIKNAFDNIIGILLGAILSRTVVGASPFLPTVVTCFVICLLHRLCGWLSVRSHIFDRIANGKKILVYKDGAMIRKNMERALVNEKDITEGLRRVALTDDLEQIDAIYVERNGEVSAVKKQKQ